LPFHRKSDGSLSVEHCLQNIDGTGNEKGPHLSEQSGPIA
jgi:hypothetical protein